MVDAPTTRAPRTRVHNQEASGDTAPVAEVARTASTAELRMPSRDLATPRSAVITDAANRRLIVRKLSAMDRLNMYEAAGTMSSNEGWMGMCALACSCVDIDGEKVDKPMSPLEMKALVARLEEDGMNAIEHVYLKVFNVKDEAAAPKIKN